MILYTQTAQMDVYMVLTTCRINLSYAFRTMCGNGEIIARVASFTGARLGWSCYA